MSEGLAKELHGILFRSYRKGFLIWVEAIENIKVINNCGTISDLLT